MFASTILTPSKLKLSHFVLYAPNSDVEILPSGSTKYRRGRGRVALYSKLTPQDRRLFFPRSHTRPVLTARVSNGGDGAFDATSQHSSPSVCDIEELNSTSSGLGSGYVALFVRMLGLDHDPLDREQAIVALWKYSLGGKKCIDTLMQFPGCINLTVNLLRSESTSACEAAAGLLRSLSSVNLYRNSVAESGAIEEINRLLSHSSLPPEVKEQSICTLWNLSVDEKLRIKLAKSDILPLIIKYLDDEDVKVKEAAGGILANLALSHVNHNILVEAGAIPKLAKFLTSDSEESKVIKKEARNALQELVKDDYYRILIVEEGLVPVPLVGTDAFKSFTPGLYSWPTLPDGTEIEKTSKQPSKFGASELLLGLNIDERNANIDEAKMNAIVGRTQQQFLARIGAIEWEGKKESHSEGSDGQRFTLLPWMDGVARLVLILELEDKSAITRAADSIADVSINEHMRIAFKEAGAIKPLVRLLDSDDDAVKLAVTRALERLCASNVVCQIIEAEGVLGPLISILKCSKISEPLAEKSLNTIARILDPSKEMKLKFYDGPVNGSEKCFRNDVLDSAFVGRLVEILKSSTPHLQGKAALVLEFVALTDPTMVSLISVDIESGLDAAFQQKILKISDGDSDIEDQLLEAYPVEVEEAGLAISAASRLMTRLLDSQQFRDKINSPHFIALLRGILKSCIPLHSKDWVAACLVKLSSVSTQTSSNPINAEVTLYETIPRLIEQIKTSFSAEALESAAVELNRIVSEGVVDATRAIVSEGAIYPLVKMIETGSDRGVEAGLAILYNLSMDSENHSAIVSAGAVPVLRRIVLSQRPQWVRALHLLRSLPT
ncbi:U-box domain-containing protein 12 [Senna tora]|uniref:U-box domain-containing protein 12 n=1 Tax=Senna tora TaxID=362788 RepID=A0A834W984_9FABA|nr:U-box domain-containing protein 12 [Senna tora]